MSRPKGVPTGVSIRILTAGSVRAITRSVGGQGVCRFDHRVCTVLLDEHVGGAVDVRGRWMAV
jgi:hypothetical protein